MRGAGWDVSWDRLWWGRACRVPVCVSAAQCGSRRSRDRACVVNKSRWSLVAKIGGNVRTRRRTRCGSSGRSINDVFHQYSTMLHQWASLSAEQGGLWVHGLSSPLSSDVDGTRPPGRGERNVANQRVLTVKVSRWIGRGVCERPSAACSSQLLYCGLITLHPTTPWLCLLWLCLFMVLTTLPLNGRATGRAS